MNMIVRATAALLFAATCSSFSSNANAQARVALVVGNSKYTHVGALPNPQNDAEALAILLKSAGFDVDKRLDLGIAELRRAVREFSERARQAEMAVVYFAGHGIEVNGTNYLIPADAKLEHDFDVEDETISLDRVLQAIDPAKRLRLVILDACRDNPFLRRIKRTVASRSIGRGLSGVEPATTDTLIAFAAKAGSTAADGTGTNSPYATALLKHLSVPGLDLRLAFGRVRDEVMKLTSRRQEPFVYGSLGGSVISLMPDAAMAAGEARPDDATAATERMRRDFELAARVGTRDALQSFLNQNETGFYSELARSQIAKLDAPTAAPVQIAAAGGTALPRNISGKSLVVHFLETREIPQGANMPRQVRRNITVDADANGTISTIHTLLNLKQTPLRSFKASAPLKQVDTGMTWDLSDRGLVGTFAFGGFTIKPTIEIADNTCAAQIAYERPDGGGAFKLTNLSGQTTETSEMVASDVKCEIVTKGPEKR